MREKELRIALVCFGGVSLAVYMHGISKEILKLVRASAALHAIGDRALRANARFFDRFDAGDPEYDTESVYFELLREIGRTVELRIIVDIIAGASAGGINGAMLARALARDLPMGNLRELWLRDADVTELLALDARAKRWSKAFLQPVIWAIARSRRLSEIKDPEIRGKMSLFVRSRWFKPPFDGLRMAQLMFDAASSMGDASEPRRSLIPGGQQLELFVTATDYYGYQRLIEIHDPPLIREREHRHVMRFSHRCPPGGAVETDFDLANAPALAFAARATSSFPGAFPPAQISEIDRLLEQRGIDWPGRESFIARNFEPYARARMDPLAGAFIDGSVLNNKPFHEAIQAIKGRPAYRQVDRRLVYIDPDPRTPQRGGNGSSGRAGQPGFFAMLKGALSDIPRNEPIADELSWVDGFNERVRRLKTIVDSARPHVTELVAEAIGQSGAHPSGTNAAPTRLPDQILSADRVRRWRAEINDAVARDSGFAYEGYVRLKLAAVRASIGQLITAILQVPPRSPAARMITEIIEAWAARAGILYGASTQPTNPARNGAMDDPVAAAEDAIPGDTLLGDLAPWTNFLLTFDLDYRKRRLVFLIQGQNRLYQMIGERMDGRKSGAEACAAALDRMKRAFYKALDLLRQREKPHFFTAATRQGLRRLFAALPEFASVSPVGPGGSIHRGLAERAAAFAAEHAAELDAIMAQLGGEIRLDAGTGELDTLLAEMDPAIIPAGLRQEVLVNYLGFPFWDVLTLSVTNWRDVGEFDEILVDRISPEDAATLRNFATPTSLKGTGFAHFAAFFSRGYRENDYLLGRLHGVDRLIDLVFDSAAASGATEGIDVVGLKCRAFEIVLAAEEAHLPHCAGLISALREEIAALKRS